MANKSIQLVIAAAVMAFASVAHAHGPTPQKVEEKIAINAPPAEVWKVVKDFAGFGSWHPLVAKVKGSGTDTTRTSTLKAGGELVDSLDTVDDTAMSLGYRLQNEDFKALPVSSYSMEIDVKPAGGGSEVEWISRLYRADTGNDPAEDKNDEAAIKASTDFIKAGLDGLKAKVEGKK
jgi:mxaD protein